MAATRVKTKGSTKASGITFIVLGVVLIIIAAIILITHSGYMISGECIDLQEYITGSKAGQRFPTGEYVKINLNSVIANYAETQHKTNGIPTGKDQYYVALLDDSSFISVKIKGSSNVKKMNDIVDATWNSDDWISSTAYEATGMLKSSISNSEIRGFYKDFFQEFCDYLGISYSDLTSEFEVREYEIDCTDSRGSLWSIFAILGGIGAVLIFAGIVTVKKAAKMDDTPSAAYSNAGYNPVDTSQPYNPAGDAQPYNPVDTSQPYNPAGAQSYDQTGAYNQAGTQSYDQTGTYNQAGAQSYDQTGAYNQAGYDQTYNQADPYNQNSGMTLNGEKTDNYQ